MDEITVLSPHRDDAAFSLSLCLTKWSSKDIRIVNFFTVSSYGPRTASRSPRVISNIREREDRDALSSISTRIKTESLDLLDAPLRLGISADCVCKLETWQMRGGIDGDALASAPHRRFVHGVVLAPLGLGNHVDHLAVREGAIKSVPHRQLGFYEDLPYATWTPQSSLRERLSDTEQRTGITLKSFIIRSQRAVPRKRRLISKYHSQIDRHGANEIAQFALAYRGGERIWIPKHSRAWRTLISDV